MKIIEKIERDCCQSRDMQPYSGVLEGDLYFCRHCGELFVKGPMTHENGNACFSKFFQGKTAHAAFLELLEHRGAWVSSADCSVKEIVRAQVDGRWFQIDSFGFVRLPKEWFDKTVGV